MDLSKYFTGRLNRLNFLLGAISIFVISAILSKFDGRDAWGLFTGLAVLFSIFFGFSLYIRRLHDISKSGWWSLLMLVPLVNIIFFFYLVFTDSTGKNKFGAVPGKKIKFPNDILLLK